MLFSLPGSNWPLYEYYNSPSWGNEWKRTDSNLDSLTAGAHARFAGKLLCADGPIVFLRGAQLYAALRLAWHGSQSLPQSITIKKFQMI